MWLAVLAKCLRHFDYLLTLNETIFKYRSNKVTAKCTNKLYQLTNGLKCYSLKNCEETRGIN